MEHFAGLNVAMEETAVCVVDLAGAIVHESSVATDPDAIAEALAPWGATLGRVGHEAGSLSPWLQPALEGLGVPAVCLETRNVRAAMAAQRNKTDQKRRSRDLRELCPVRWANGSSVLAVPNVAIAAVLRARAHGSSRDEGGMGGSERLTSCLRVKGGKAAISSWRL